MHWPRTHTHMYKHSMATLSVEFFSFLHSCTTRETSTPYLTISKKETQTESPPSFSVRGLRDNSILKIVSHTALILCFHDIRAKNAEGTVAEGDISASVEVLRSDRNSPGPALKD